MKINTLRIKRKFYVFVGKIIRNLKSPQTHTRKPKVMTYSESSAFTIFMRVLKLPETKLYYDLVTQECYLKSEEYQLYVFLEERNLKIINSVFGYDVRISQELETYLTEKFSQEMAIRRRAFKNEALSKVDHSLELTIQRVLKETKPNV
jgi:hypothetical protein